MKYYRKAMEELENFKCAGCKETDKKKYFFTYNSKDYCFDCKKKAELKCICGSDKEPIVELWGCMHCEECRRRCMSCKKRFSFYEMHLAYTSPLGEMWYCKECWEDFKKEVGKIIAKLVENSY